MNNENKETHFINKAFLDITPPDSPFRKAIKSGLKLDYYDPSDDPEINAVEMKAKCNIHYYLVTSNMDGLFPVTKILDSAFKYPEVLTILHIIPDGFDASELSRLQMTAKTVNDLGGIAFSHNDIGLSAYLLNGTLTHDISNSELLREKVRETIKQLGD